MNNFKTIKLTVELALLVRQDSPHVSDPSLSGSLLSSLNRDVNEWAHRAALDSGVAIAANPLTTWQALP